jgi:hypothetical protein
VSCFTKKEQKKKYIYKEREGTQGRKLVEFHSDKPFDDYICLLLFYCVFLLLFGYDYFIFVCLFYFDLFFFCMSSFYGREA